MKKLLCILGIHIYKWGEVYEVTYGQHTINLNGYRELLVEPIEYVKYMQDGTCTICGKVKTVVVRD